MATLKDRLSELLVKSEKITSAQLEEALKIHREKKEKVGDILIRLNYISHDDFMGVLSAELGIPVMRLTRLKIQSSVVAMVPKKAAEFHGVMPVSIVGKTLTLAMTDPTNIQAIDDVRRMTGFDVQPVIAGKKEIKEAVEQYYGENVSQALQDVMRDMDLEGRLELDETHGGEGGNVQQLLRLTEEQPVVKLANSVLAEAVQRRASDIFVEPEEKNLRVRFRVDGMIQEGLVISKSMHAGVVSRLKVMSGLDIAEHRIPQDGRFKIRLREKNIDFRVSVLPTYFGEKVVLRVLDKNQSVLDLDQSGFEKEPLDALKKAALHPHGMITICGPTGSGKTTTLYSLMKMIDKPETNIVTVEDPVEFQIDGINQVTIRTEVNLTFAAALRSILRQDPDIIMVGEVRDSETADVAVKAALTGHLVLSTLHATTAPGAITRLLNMGIEPFLITSSLLLAGSQRLVRRVCLQCKESYEPSEDLIRQLGFPKTTKKMTFFRGKGCDACNRKGYSGRAVLLEALVLTPTIKALILKGAQEYQLKAVGRKEGMKTLRENGLAKILQGITTPEEVMRVTIRDQEVDEIAKGAAHGD